MHTFVALKRKTAEFFRRHWNSGAAPTDAPKWKRWKLRGRPAVHNSGGCYAVFSKRALLYVGVALTTGRSTNPAKATVGLYNRLRRHVIKPVSRNSMVHVGKTQRWNAVTHIELLAFPDKYRYLAAALEAYLISELKPPENRYT